MPTLQEAVAICPTYRRRLVVLLLVNSKHGYYSVPLFTVNLQLTFRTTALVCLWSVGIGLSGVLFYKLYKRFCVSNIKTQEKTSLIADNVVERDLVEKVDACHLMGNIHSLSDIGGSNGYHENGHFVRAVELKETVRPVKRDEEASSIVQPETSAKDASSNKKSSNVEALKKDGSLASSMFKNGVSLNKEASVMQEIFLAGTQQDDADSGWEAGTATEDSLSSPDEIGLPKVWSHRGTKAAVAAACDEDTEVIMFARTSTPAKPTSPTSIVKEEPHVPFTCSSSWAARLAALESRFQLRLHKSLRNDDDSGSRAVSVEARVMRRTGSSPPDSTCHFSSFSQECFIDVRPQLQCSSLDNSPLAARYKRRLMGFDTSGLCTTNDWIFNSMDSEDDSAAVESHLCLKDLESDAKLDLLMEELKKVQRDVDSLSKFVCRADAHSTSQIVTIESTNLQLQNCSHLLADVKNQLDLSVDGLTLEPVYDIDNKIEKLLRESGYEFLLSTNDRTSVAPVQWSVGPLTKLDEYAAHEWRGNTPLAQRIRLAYNSISPEKGVFLRRIRGDNYCALRAALFQLLLHGLEPLDCAESACARLSLASKRHAWLRDGQWICPRWREIHRGTSNLKNNIDLAACLRQLYSQCTTLSKVECIRMREWLLLELFNTQPRVEIALLEAVKVLMALRTIELHASLRAAEQADFEANAAPSVPFYTWLLFARDTSADPASFYHEHLCRVGDTGGLEQVEMMLLADVLGVRLRVIRLSAASPHADDAEVLFCGEERVSHCEALPILTLLAEDDRHYNILVS